MRHVVVGRCLLLRAVRISLYAPMVSLLVLEIARAWKLSLSTRLEVYDAKTEGNVPIPKPSRGAIRPFGPTMSFISFKEILSLGFSNWQLSLKINY